MNENKHQSSESHDFVAPATQEMTNTEADINEQTAEEIIQFVRENYADALDSETLLSIEEVFANIETIEDFDDACGYLLTTLLKNGFTEEDYMNICSPTE